MACGTKFDSKFEEFFGISIKKKRYSWYANNLFLLVKYFHYLWKVSSGEKYCQKFQTGDFNLSDLIDLLEH